MAAQIESLAGLQKGQLSLKDFEWEVHMRPTPWPSRASAISIPEIDLQSLYEHHTPLESNHACNHTQYANLVAAVSQAASSVGFFQVLNHGISLSALETLHSYARRFFSLPLDRKYEAVKFLAHPSAGPSGYVGGSPADTPNKWWTEAVRVASSDKQALLSLAKCLSSEERDQQAFSEILEECSSKFAKLAKDLTIVLIEGLGLKGHEVVEKYIGGEIAGLKMNHYPACPQPNMTLGLPPHSDVSILTLLWQDLVGGLQVHVNGEWITVKPRRDALVVNIGDVFQVWSNDRYLSGLHRAVLNAHESRYSITYFYYSGVDSMLTPIQELLQKTKESSKFKSTLMSEHRSYVYSQVYKRGSEGVGYLKC